MAFAAFAASPGVREDAKQITLYSFFRQKQGKTQIFSPVFDCRPVADWNGGKLKAPGKDFLLRRLEVVNVQRDFRAGCFCHVDDTAASEAEAEAAAEAERQAAEAAAAADNNWHCDVCDRDNDMNFCPGCGAARPDEKTCEGCGYERPDDGYLFCPNCGQKYQCQNERDLPLQDAQREIFCCLLNHYVKELAEEENCLQ